MKKDIKKLHKPNEETFEQKTLKYKIISYLYFPLQYFIVRFLLLGTDIQPTLIQFYNGFNIGGITRLIIEFISSIPQTFTAENYIYLILEIIPYLFKLAWELKSILLYVYVLWQLIVFIISQISILKTKPSM